MSEKRTYAIEDVLGVLLLTAGLFAFGLFNFKSDEPLVEAGLRAQSRAIVSDSVHGLRAMVDGREITLSGLADSVEEKAQIVAALKDLDGRGRLRLDVTVLEPVDPFVMIVRSKETQPLEFEGVVPTEAMRRDLRSDYGEGVDALTLASGMPDEHWPAVAQMALRALTELEHGTLNLQDRTILIAGSILTPAAVERTVLLLSDLPDGYSFETDLEVLDDGSPLRLSASRREGAFTGVSGKLPVDLIPDLEGEIKPSVLALPFDDWGDSIHAGLAALEPLQAGHLSITGTNLTLTGEAWSQAAYDTAYNALRHVPSHMAVSLQIVLADSGAPFGLTLGLTQAGVAATGKVPRSLAPRVLAALVDAPVEASGLEVARISPGPVWWEAASLGAEALRFFETGELTFDGKALALSGAVQDPPRMELLQRHLDAMPEAISLALNVTLIDDGSPVRLTLEYDGETAVLSGKLPDNLRMDQLAEELQAPVLSGDELLSTPKSGPDDWAETALAGAGALAAFERGVFSLNGREISLRGELRNPDREVAVLGMLAALPEAYTVETDFIFRDDGRPFGFVLMFDGRRGVLNGKVPNDLGPASQSAILGFPIESGKLTFAEIPADADWWSAARAGLKALAELDHGSLTLDAHQIEVTGTSSDPDAKARIEIRLAPFSDTFKLVVDIADP